MDRLDRSLLHEHSTTSARVQAYAALREAIVFPGTRVEDGEILIGAIAGRTGIVDSLRPLDELASAGLG